MEVLGANALFRKCKPIVRKERGEEISQSIGGDRFLDYPPLRNEPQCSTADPYNDTGIFQKS